MESVPSSRWDFDTGISRTYTSIYKNHPAKFLVCRGHRTDEEKAPVGALCKVKAAVYMLCFLRSMGRQKEVVWMFATALMRAFKCLLAHFAWGRQFLAALRDHDQSEAGASETMTFLSSVQILDKDHCPAELLGWSQTVSSPDRGHEQSSDLLDDRQVFPTTQMSCVEVQEVTLKQRHLKTCSATASGEGYL